MSPFHFALTGLLTLLFSVWFNLNTSIVQPEFYWPILLISPFVFMTVIVLVSKTFFGLINIFSKN